jgi:site-specific DNA-adenine methylase
VNYPGGKGGPGIYQRIISLMPPHDVYIEAFVGGGNLLTRKRQASSSIVIDADGDVAAYEGAR